MKFYRCRECGKITAMIKGSECPTMCCNQEMTELKANTTDAAAEKHVPVVSVSGNKVSVNVGSAAHPMEEKHFIQWICLETSQGFQMKNLQPGNKPEASFALSDEESAVKAYAFCNLHSLWASK